MKKNDSIIEKKKELSELVERLKSGAVPLPKKITVRDKLEVIKDELLQMQRMDIPTTLIRKILQEKGIEVGYQTLRKYLKSVVNGEPQQIPRSDMKDVKKRLANPLELK